MMQAGRAHQTTVSARGYLPYPLNPPYYINRTEEYQKRVFEYARNYFSPAEMDDLMRLELFFVPQEAERIKRNLRRKGDFDEENHLHPSGSSTNYERRNNALGGATTQSGNPFPLMGRAVGEDDANVRPIPQEGRPLVRSTLNNLAWPQADQPQNPGQNVYGRLYEGTDPVTGQYRGRSLLRRVELFIASMFVFDCAHGLLAHLHEEAISLTSHGTEADENLLKQIIRNVRGYSFRRLARVTGTPNAPGQQIDMAFTQDAAAINNRRPAFLPDAQKPHINIKDDPSQPFLEHPYRPLQPCFGTAAGYHQRDFTLEDFSEPLSTTELKQLQSVGWIRRNGKFYAPTRFPASLAAYAAPDGAMPRDERLRATNAAVLDPSRTMGIYPVTFLTNTTIADDACAARLIEHCTSDRMDPQVFSWGMRRQVFMPLEVDVADIYRFSDLKDYDDLHEALNAFSNGMFAGVSLRGMWADYIRPRLSRVVTQVPLNQLRKYENVLKSIEIPAAPGEMRHTAGQAEVIRLYNKSDDVLRKIDEWFQLGGDFSKVSYDAYRQADPNDPEAILGNNAHGAGWGERALGVGKCGPGYLPQFYNTDPDLNSNAKPVEREIIGPDGRPYLNPRAKFEKCAPAVHNLKRMPRGGEDVRVNQRVRTYARQRRAARKGKAKKK